MDAERCGSCFLSSAVSATSGTGSVSGKTSSAGRWAGVLRVVRRAVCRRVLDGGTGVSSALVSPATLAARPLAMLHDE